MPSSLKRELNRCTLLMILAFVLSVPGISFAQDSTSSSPPTFVSPPTDSGDTTTTDPGSTLPSIPDPGTNSPIAPTPVGFSTNMPEATTIGAPTSFNPLTASASDLASWCYPPRPDQSAAPKGYAVWFKAISAAQIRKFPNLSRTVHIHGTQTAAQSVNLNNATPDVAQTTNSALGSYNWSGYLNTIGRRLRRRLPSTRCRALNKPSVAAQGIGIIPPLGSALMVREPGKAVCCRLVVNPMPIVLCRRTQLT